MQLCQVAASRACLPPRAPVLGIRFYRIKMMKFKVFDDVDRMWSRWHGQGCPLCKEGTLSDGVRKRTKVIAGTAHTYRQVAAWCNHCGEGIVISDPIEEVGFEDFLEAKRVFEQDDVSVAV